MLDNYVAFDIDDLANINEYNDSILFYEDGIKNAISRSENKNIILGSCINPTDFEKIKMPEEVNSYKSILLTCSNEKLEERLRDRDESRNCSSDEFIKGQIDYQNYLLKHIDSYQLHLDNSVCSIDDLSNQIVNYILKKEKQHKTTL